MRHVFGRRAAFAIALIALLPLSACAKKGNDSASADTTTPATVAKVTAVAGKAHVTGTIASMNATAASFDPIPTPFTFRVPDAGRGGLDLPQAIVDGASNAIVWTGGRPLPVTGTCQLDVGEATTTIDAAGAHIALDGAVRALTAGTCRFGSSVAVGAHGISNPVDSVQFSLPSESDFTTSGGAALTVPATRRYEGREGGLDLKGPLKVETEDNTFTASGVTVDTGTWVVTLTAGASPSTYKVVADLEGKLRIAS